jgi:hypothetical protein
MRIEEEIKQSRFKGANEKPLSIFFIQVIG